jgi:hypothetical protein
MPHIKSYRELAGFVYFLHYKRNYIYLFLGDFPAVHLDISVTGIVELEDTSIC